MAKMKELSVGTSVTRKETGQIGKIVNLYSGNYIVELSDGDGYRHETRVVTPEALKAEYSTHAVSAALHITAEEAKTFQDVQKFWTNSLTKLMLTAVNELSPIPLSGLEGIDVSDPQQLAGATGAAQQIIAFAQQAAEDIAVIESGEVFTNAAATLNNAIIKSKYSGLKAANERAYRELLPEVQGTPAEAAVTKSYNKKKEAIEARERQEQKGSDRIKPADYSNAEYMRQVAKAIWINTDIYPRIIALLSNSKPAQIWTAEFPAALAEAETKIKDEAKAKGLSDEQAAGLAEQQADGMARSMVLAQGGMDPAAMLEQPLPPRLQELNIPAEELEAISPVVEEEYQEKVKAYKEIATNLKQMLKSSDEVKALGMVLPGKTFSRVVNNINKAATPAEIFNSMVNYTATTLSRPQTGTQTKHMGHEPKALPQGSTWAEEYDYKLQAENPEYSSVSAIAEERQMRAYRQEFVDAVAQKDFQRAEATLASMRETATEYKKTYENIIKSIGVSNKPSQNQIAAAADFDKATAELGRLHGKWQAEATEEIDLPERGATGGKTAAINGFGAGSPVKYKNQPGVHFIVSYDDHDPLKMYLIAESDVNSHDRTELIEASMDDVQPLKIYNIDIGDVVDAFGSVGRVVDASAKDIGYVYAELRSGQIVPIDLEKTDITWHYAEPIQLCACANDGGIITPGQESNCPHHPFFAPPMMGRKKEKDLVPPPTDAKAVEKNAMLTLQAALEDLDVATAFPPPAKGVEIYEDESSPIEIGSAVKKFGTMITGTVVGFKRNCCVVDWETGASEACWKQELVLVTVQED